MTNDQFPMSNDKKRDARGLNLDELTNLLELPKFRAKQVFAWIHDKHASSFAQMSNLPKAVQADLASKFSLSSPKILKKLVSKDKTVKYLLELEDGLKIETVHMTEGKGRVTVCVSSQAGCPFGCKFCATGMMGFKRNLTVSEILSQVYLSDKVNNVVFMGMGEPFLNYENVIKSIRILNDELGMRIGARKITVSTAGVPEGIIELADFNLQVRLAVSLNSAIDSVRSEIMPINHKYHLSSLKIALQKYQRATGRRITLEYVMLKNINDLKESGKALVEFCQGLHVNVNLIPFNAHQGSLEQSPHIDEFLKYLKANGIEAVKRLSRGQDIMAACGQLAA